MTFKLFFWAFFPPGPGEDYNPINLQVTFSSEQVNNEDRECIIIEIIDDNDFESDHTFEVQIASLTPSTVASSSGTAIVIIQDNNGDLHTWMRLV